MAISSNTLKYSLPPLLQSAVEAAADEWQSRGNLRRLWQRDASLWTGADEAKWLGWLDIVAEQRTNVARLQRLAAELREANFTHAVLLGMGGSSLGAEVFANTFGAQTGWPKLLVVDSTNPADIKATEDAIDLARTLFIVSSKSGTTLEPNILKDYFFARVEDVLGKGKAGAQFIAITDPGSKLESAAKAEGFRHISFGKAEIGGRYSVLSDFGLVPAAVMGVDVERLLGSAAIDVRACGPDDAVRENPGAMLGIVLGVLARETRDKLTIIASPGISDIGAWLEQLVAESTGKQGKGIIPLEGEPLAPPGLYGQDRLFAYLRLDEAPDERQDKAVARLEQAGRPVVRIAISQRYEIGGEFFRWEMATAIAGAILGINPFDQPDVEASKVKTRELMDAYERNGSLPPETPFCEDDGIVLFADEANAAALKQAGDNMTLAGVLRAHLARVREKDYCALLVYVARNDAHHAQLQSMRTAIRDAKRVATCVGFGPRFLHSTGQDYKGGPNSGVFLQITSEHAVDLQVPGRKYSFGAVVAAQARGDLAVLNERGRRALRVHLSADVKLGLERLDHAIRDALG
jgi:transaldolase/glucose-6-phosphate isomerase